MKRNAYLEKQSQQRDDFMHAVEGIVRQYDIDTMHVTLNEELGLGYEKLMYITDKWMANQKKYREAVNPHAYVEADVAQEHLDRKLARIAARKNGEFFPFQERYPNLRKIKY